MKSTWKFLVYEPTTGCIIRNCTSDFLAYETSKGFSSLVVKPIPYTQETQAFFTRDINKEENTFSPNHYKIIPIEEIPDEIVAIKNLFHNRLKFISKVLNYVDSRLFEMQNSFSSTADRYLVLELERIYRDSNYVSDIINEYAKEIEWSYESFLQELKILDHEKRLRTIRIHAKFRKFCDRIHETEDYDEMDRLMTEFLQHHYQDRLQ
jgi:hypothetical protein